MLRTTCFAGLAALCMVLLTEPCCYAQLGGSTVSGSGHANIRVTPTRLRMHMPLWAYGKTPELALDNLKSRREAVAAHVASSGADPRSLSVASPRVEFLTRPASQAWGAFPSSSTSFPIAPFASPVPAPASPPAMAPIQQSPAAPTSQVQTYADPAAPVQSVLVQPAPGQTIPAPAAPAPVAIQSAPPPSSTPAASLYIAITTIRAEWPLPGDSQDAVAAFAALVQDRVRASVRADDKVQKDLTAGERALIQEIEGSRWQPPSPFQSDSVTIGPAGAPTTKFVYVGMISDAERKAALASAFEKARQNASELASAAGIRLGPLDALNRQTNFSSNISLFGGMETASPLKPLSEVEAVASRPDELEFSVDVFAYFRLIESGPMP